MPSKQHAAMSARFRAARDRPAPPSSLAEQRRQPGLNSVPYAPVPGVALAPAPGLRPGSYLLTPDGPRDDLLVLFLHGGGFRSGSPDTVRGAGARLAAALGVRVLLPAYRLAPEKPFPAALDDAEAGFVWATSLLPGAQIAVGGESAGANLGLSLLLRRRDAGDRRALAGFLFSGAFDLRPERHAEGSWVTNEETDLLMSARFGLATSRDYLAGHDPADPAASPLLADLTGLPPLLLEVSGAEVLLDDSLELAARAARSGASVALDVQPDLHHSWQVAAGFLPEADASLRRAAAFIERATHGPIP
ncbi:alpha/beta hydrolase [Streptomyces sp. 8N706]|uniref:alpha/beta hydrolase n=1 Tax=Streptomyces sp. 8N706 TaxID=3457416 RepID=UPI003FCF4804